MAPGNDALALWLAATNSASAGVGKMFSPQSIAIGIGAVGPALKAYIDANKDTIDDKKAKELEDSIQANVIMQNVAKYFVLSTSS